MFCTKCGNQINNGEKFCTGCGHPTTVNEPSKRSNEEVKNDLGENMKQIVDHLEFLGYKIKLVDPENKEGKILALATHDKLGNLIFHEPSQGLILFQIFYNTKKKVTEKMYHLVNQANQVADILKVQLVDEEGGASLKYETVYLGDYSKTQFGRFHELAENDQKRILTIESFVQTFS